MVRATLIGSQRVAFPLGGFAFRSIEPSAGHLELQLPEGPQQRARAMAVPVTGNVLCLLRIAACSHRTTSIARAAKRFLKLCFEQLSAIALNRSRDSLLHHAQPLPKRRSFAAGESRR